jgi:hypothetical protein
MEVGDANVSTYMQTVLDDGNEAEVRSTLDVAKRHWIDVTEAPYNATGDGATDDTAAIQAALTAAQTSGQAVVLPAGTYKLSAPLVGHNHLVIRGVPYATTLTMATVDTPIIDLSAVPAGAEYVDVSGIIFTASVNGCVGILGYRDCSEYTSELRIAKCRFDAELQCGLDGLFAYLHVDETRFGFHGTPGPICQAVYLRGINAAYGFGHLFTHSYFAKQIDCNGVIEAGVGKSLTFVNCTFEQTKVPVLYSRGMMSTSFLGGCIEAIDTDTVATGGEDVVFDVREDVGGVGHRAMLKFSGTTFAQTAGMTTALVYTDSGASVTFENARITGGGNYLTMRAGPQYDRGLSVYECFITGQAGSVNERWSTRRSLELRGEYMFLSAPSATEPPGYANYIYLDDGTNTTHGNRGFRHWDGAAWRDVGDTYSAVTHDYGGGSATWSMTAQESAGTYIYVANTGGAAIAQFIRAFPGKTFVVNNGAAHNITFRVGASGGAVATAGKRSLWYFHAANTVKLYEEP